MKFYLLNVFTKDGKNGNQLATVMNDGSLSDSQMLQIAKEFNFSESIFLNQFNIRIFTPSGELPFAGHPTVGAGWLLNHLHPGKKNFSYIVPLGEISVEVDDAVTIKYPGAPVVSDFTGTLPVSENAIAGVVKTINAGPIFNVIPMISERALRDVKLPAIPVPGIRNYFFYEHNENQFSVRMLGSREDAATGSAACALAGYLKEVRGMKSGRVAISQGKDINRECEILLKWDDSISIGGRVTLWGEGTLKL